MRADARHADRAGQEQPVPRPHASRRISTCSAACAPASSRTAPACCAPRSTWPPATSTCATRCSIASCTRAHPRTGTHVVHLSELRFRPRPVGRDRGRHAFDLHAGIRGPPAALRLVPRQPAGAVAAAPVRIRAPQPQLHGAVEARADRAGARRPRERLGRSAHADACRACAGAACRRRRSAISSSASASPRPTAWSMSRMFDFSVREVSTRPRSGAWRCCGRSRS